MSLKTYLSLPLLSFTLVLVSSASAQTPAPGAANPQYGPLIAHGRMMFQGMKGWLIASAEKMSEEQYSYKPAPGVRSYGEIIGHLADQNYRFCSLTIGETNPRPEKLDVSKLKRTELIATLKEALTYCERAYGTLTDANAAQPVKLGSISHPRINLLNINLAHSALHYGNLITYMRMNNVIPPSSDFPGTAPVKAGQ